MKDLLLGAGFAMMLFGLSELGYDLFPVFMGLLYGAAFSVRMYELITEKADE